MPVGKSLTEQQNELLREAILLLLKRPRYSGTQTRLAGDLKISQGAISAFLARRQGSSFHVAMRVADLLGVDVMQLLGVRAAGSDDPVIERAEAARFARVNGVREDAIIQVLGRAPNATLTAEQWYGRMKAKALELDEDDAAAKGKTPRQEPTPVTPVPATIVRKHRRA